MSANMMNGVARLINAYGDELKDDVFKEKVGRCSVKEIARTAKERRPGSLGYAEALLLAYNKNGRSQQLKFETLYTHKIQAKTEEAEPTPESDEMETEEGQLDIFHMADGQ
jgi:hypothetical protein